MSNEDALKMIREVAATGPLPKQHQQHVHQQVRYILAGRWEYSCSVRVDPQTQHELYDGRVHDMLQFTSGDTAYETCPWCGVTGRGGIRCEPGCGAFTCHGTVYQRGPETWARCVCGKDGRLTMSHYVQIGIFPKVRAR
jgi:hypothetical protein